MRPARRCGPEVLIEECEVVYDSCPMRAQPMPWAAVGLVPRSCDRHHIPQ